MTRTYRDTPIGGGIQPSPEVPVTPRIRELMDVLDSDGGDSVPASTMFVRAARMMEDYEDDLPYTGRFPQVLRTYRSMDAAQLRGYFTWRSHVRRGDAERTPYPSFAYTYACELINGVGWRDPDEGFGMLTDLLVGYSDTDWFPYAFDWICDFAACYGVVLRKGLDSRYSVAVRALEHLDSLGPSEVMPLLKVVSSYDLGRSKAHMLHPRETEGMAVLTLRSLDEGWRRVSGVGLLDTILPSEWRSYYSMFPTAVYEDAGDGGSREYDIDGVARYSRRHGSWAKSTHRLEPGGTRTVGYAMRDLDRRLRIRFGISPVLKPVVRDDSWIAGCVMSAMEQWDRGEKARALASISIDPGNLGRIRRDADDTMERIMTSEERPEPEEAPAPSADAIGPLDEDEARFLRLLLSGGDWRSFLGERRLMESVVVDSINSKLYDAFGDNVLEEGPDGPEPVDDYIKDVEAIVSP